MFKARILDEIQQKSNFQRSLVLKILNSKRLLIDHVEILEECLGDLTRNSVNSNNFGLAKAAAGTCCSLGSFMVLGNTKFFRCRYILPTISSIYTVASIIKSTNRLKYSKKEQKLLGLIAAIEKFESSVKKNILFLTESLHLKAHAGFSMKLGISEELISNCISSTIAAIKNIHEATKKLETDFEINPQYDSLYQPLEALEDCEYFQKPSDEYDVKTIKDFYNIFAYVQSQFLMRLGLIIVSGLQMPLLILKELTDKVVENTETNFRVLNLIASKRERGSRPPQKHRDSNPNQLPLEVSNIKTFSFNVSVKLLALANECCNMDSLIHEMSQNFDGNKTGFEGLLADMNAIENEILTCQDEFHRLLITYKKFLNKDAKDDSPSVEEKVPERIEDKDEKIYSEKDKQLFVDEFFAVDGFEDDSSDEDKGSKDNFEDLENLNSRIAKKYFRPVLMQLKEKIEPIGEAFKEREKKVLKEKGIEFEADLARPESSNEDSSDDDDNYRRKQKVTKSRQKYDENRGFLMAKEQLNIFGFKPIGSIVHEDVLE